MLASVFVNLAEKPGGCPTRPAIYYVSSDLSSKEEGEGEARRRRRGLAARRRRRPFFNITAIDHPAIKGINASRDIPPMRLEPD